MTEVAKAMCMYLLTSGMTALATRYHLTGEQTAAITADVVAGATMLTGVALHWLAYNSLPPGAGK